MIVEYIRYNIDSAEREAFEEAYKQAAKPLIASVHCLAYELTRCTEEPSAYMLRIEWDSAEGHLQGFRGSPEFRNFFGHIKPFVSSIAEMRHYELIGLERKKVQSEYAGAFSSGHSDTSERFEEILGETNFGK
jgi:quinol monooxygenase YgiN